MRCLRWPSELERLCEDCRAMMTLARQSEDTATERLLAARVMPLEQAVWGLNQFCRLGPRAARWLPARRCHNRESWGSPQHGSASAPSSRC